MYGWNSEGKIVAEVLNNGLSSKEIPGIKLNWGILRNAHARMLGEEHDMEVALPLQESAKEILHGVGRMEQLKAW